MLIFIGIIVLFIIYKLATSTAGKHNVIRNEILGMLQSGITNKPLNFISWDSFCYYANKQNLKSDNRNPKNKFDHTRFAGTVQYFGKTYITVFSKFGDSVLVNLINPDNTSTNNLSNKINLKSTNNTEALSVVDWAWWEILDENWKKTYLEQGINQIIDNYELDDEYIIEPFLFRLKYLNELNLNLKDLKNLIYVEKNGTADEFVQRAVNSTKGLPYQNHQILSITDETISSLSFFKNLNTLSIENFDINDLSPITKLQNLEHLTFKSNKLSHTDLTPLTYLPKLISLTITSNHINNLETISNLRKLEELSLFINEVNDISNLSELKNLKILNIGANSINNIDALAPLKKLEILILNYNDIDDFSVLKNLTNLKELYLTYMTIPSLEPLYGLQNLEFVYLGCSEFDQKEMERLQQQLPDCVFNFEG